MNPNEFLIVIKELQTSTQQSRQTSSIQQRMLENDSLKRKNCLKIPKYPQNQDHQHIKTKPIINSPHPSQNLKTNYVNDPNPDKNKK